MAIPDESRNVRSETKRPKKRKRPQPQVAPPIRGEQATGGTKVPDRDRPIPQTYQPPRPQVFDRVGFGGSIFDLNRRVAVANYAFEAQMGFQPSPGLLLDVVRGPMADDQLEEMMKIPTSFQRARAQAIADAEVQKILDIPDEEAGVRAAPAEGDLLAGRAAADQELQTSGLDDLGNIPVLDDVWRVGMLSTQQIVDSFVNAPAGVWFTGKAVAEDFMNRDPTFSNSREIVQQIAESVYQDFRHPLENPGYLFLDTLGVASGTAGLAARGSAASKAGRVSRAVKTGGRTDIDIENLRPQTLERIEDGQVGRAIISALVRRPLPGTFEIGPEGAKERVVLSENPLRRAFQRMYYTRLQARLLEGLREPDADTTLVTPKTGGQKLRADLRKMRQSVYSPEKTLGRRAADRLRVERKLYLTPVHEFERISRATDHVADVFRNLPLVSKKADIQGDFAGPGRFGLSLGEQYAIMLHATPGIDPAGTWIRFHENMMRIGMGDPVGHQNKIEAVKLGAQALAKPSKRLQRAIEISRRLSEEQQILKIRFLGLDEDGAVNRIATERAVLELGGAAQRVTKQVSKVPKKLLSEFARLEKRVARAERRVEKEKGKLTPEDVAEFGPEALAAGEGWKEFSRKRGYTEEEIADFERWVELNRQYPGLTPDLSLAGHARSSRQEIQEHLSRFFPDEEVDVSRQVFLEQVDELLGSSFANHFDDGWYYPQFKPEDVDLSPLDPVFGSRSSGKYGHPRPDPFRSLSELNHRFEAKAIMSGNTVVDARNLAQKYASVGRAVAAIEDWSRLLALSVDRPNRVLKHQRGFMRPIRTLEGAPDELKAKLQPFFEDRVLTAEEATDLSKSGMLEDLHAWMFPEFDPKSDKPIEGVRWVDERFAVDLHRFPGEPSNDAKFFSAINDPLRALTLYARLGYSLNALSNAGMLFIQQGPGAPVSMFKSLTARKRWGDKALAAMDSLIDEGKAKSFSPDALAVTKVSRSMANVWSVLVDRWMRRAALIHEMEKRGYKTQEQVENLLDPKNKDEKVVGKRYEISKRANQAMVEFDNLTWFEKQRLRHIIFVYPWVSRSTVWAGRTMLDRPLKTWAISELGRIGEDKVEELFEDAFGWSKQFMPEWLNESGYFPTGGFDKQGNPLLINANSTNSFSTLGDLMKTVEGTFTDDPLYSFEDMLGPLPELALRVATGRNSFGQKYEHGALGGVGEMFSQLPLGRGLSRPELGQPVLDESGKPIDVDPSSRSPGEASGFILPTKPGQAAPASERPVLIPGMDSVYGPLISSGLWPPKHLDVEAATARYWEEQPAEAKAEQRATIQAQALREKIKWEVLNIKHAEELTSNILAKPLPEGVKKLVNLQSKFMNAYLDYGVEKKLGRMPTDAEQRFIQIEVLKNEGVISQDTATDLAKELGKAISSGNMSDFTRTFGDRYLFRKELMDWHQERDIVLDVANNLPTQMDFLRKSGLFTGETPKNLNLVKKASIPRLSATQGRGVVKPLSAEADVDSPLFALGRQYLDYQKTLRSHEAPDTSRMETVEGARFKTWQAEQDKPIKIDGKTFPSPVRLEWASKILNGTLDDPNYEKKQLTTLSNQSWATLTNFEKEVVGRKVNPDMAQGWLVYAAITDGLRGNVDPDDVRDITLNTYGGETGRLSDIVPPPNASREVERANKIAIAKYIDKYYAKGFFKDFLFAVDPKYRRVGALPIIAKSKAVDDWRELFSAANQTFRQIEMLRANEETGITNLQNAWKDYVKNSLWPYIQRNKSETFRRELDLFGGEDFLRTLIEDGSA